MRIDGNLEVEVAWARRDAALRRARGEEAPSPDDPRFALPEEVMERISAAATLLRVFAERDDDELRTPRRVDAARVARVPWIASPRLVAGAAEGPFDLRWGETDDLAVAVSHRGWLARFRAANPACDLPGATLVTGEEEFAGRAAAMPAWVAKAPHAAAGRSRVRGAGAPDAQRLAQARRLLALHGCLLLEPWRERIEDAGVVVEAHGRIGLPHGLLVDPEGRFLGIRVPAAEPERWATAAAETVRAALGHEGWRRPFGLDLYRVREADGRARVVLSEVNARLTFGHVARALAARAVAAGALAAQAAMVLRFGRGAPPPGTIPLLLPGGRDGACAWMETAARHDAC